MTLPAKAQDPSRSIFNDLFFQHYYPSIITPAPFSVKSEYLLFLLLRDHHLLWLYDSLLRHELSACDFSGVTVSVWNWLRQFRVLWTCVFDLSLGIDFRLAFGVISIHSARVMISSAETLSCLLHGKRLLVEASLLDFESDRYSKERNRYSI